MKIDTYNKIDRMIEKEIDRERRREGQRGRQREAERNRGRGKERITMRENECGAQGGRAEEATEEKERDT